MVTSIYKPTPQARTVLSKRYVLRDKQHKPIEQPEDIFDRVARAVATGEKEYNTGADNFDYWNSVFYEMMARGEFLPNSPTLMNAGALSDDGKPVGSLSACFVIPVLDSMLDEDGIAEAIRTMIAVQKYGGGTGFSLSQLRPRNAYISTTHGKACGPIHVLRVLSQCSTMVTQGGKRDGANMAMLRIDHPDIMEFIHCKDRDGDIHNFNISVSVTDAFMFALRDDTYFDLIDPQTKQTWKVDLEREREDEEPTIDEELTTIFQGISYNLGDDGAVSLHAKSLWNHIVKSAHKTGDPGVVFIDRVNASTANPVPSLGGVEATNPCGEQPLNAYDACCLGSINLAKFVKGPLVSFDRPTAVIDTTGLSFTAQAGTRFLDDVLTVNQYSAQKIADLVAKLRRTGLGIMGWADALAIMRIPYNSNEAVKLARYMMQIINESAHNMSEQLANERGSFPLWEESIYGPKGKNRKQRVSTCTTIAPTGTISIIAGCSSGCEPFFSLAYKHRGLEGRIKDMFVNQLFLDALDDAGVKDTQSVLDAVIANHGSCQGIAAVPAWIQRVFVTAHDIEPRWHVAMQAAFQEHTDNAVSKTINLPNSATLEDVNEAYMSAWQLNCNGVTIYRDGSKGGQVLSNVEIPTETDSIKLTISEEYSEEIEPSVQYDVLPSTRYRQPSAHGNLYVTISDINGRPFEVFALIGKSGSETQALLEAIGRLISYTLRTSRSENRGAVLNAISKQLIGIGGLPYGFGENRVLSIPDALGRVLRKHGQFTDVIEVTAQHLSCPECGGQMSYSEGCEKCLECGEGSCS